MAKKTAPRVARIPLTKARHNHLGAIVKSVHIDKGYVILEKDGTPVVGLMDIDEFEDYLELQDEATKKIISECKREYIEGKSFPAEDLTDELRKEAQKSKRGAKAKLQDA
jgi:hypothetical protein